jgi:antitoxin component HigA of HigAB toxin-antitoxin module
MTTWIARLTDTLEKRRSFEQELAVFNATELLSGVMEERGITKADLARMLGTSRANVTNMLSGRRNLTVRTLADVAAVLGVRVKFESEALRNGEFVVMRPQTVHRRVIEPAGTLADAAPAASAATLLPETLAA